MQDRPIDTCRPDRISFDDGFSTHAGDRLLARSDRRDLGSAPGRGRNTDT